EQARRYEETSYKGLFNFINFVNKLKSGVGDMGSAKILGENENVVRLMSIHKSKGLEFPIVIISGCGRNFNLSDMSESIILHQDLGFGPDYIDLEKRIGYPSVAKQALRYKIKAESLSEEMRILYVGFTRAREKLVLTGTVRELEKSISKWKENAYTVNGKIPGYIVFRGRNYLDWICPALMTGKASREGFFGNNNNEINGGDWIRAGVGSINDNSGCKSGNGSRGRDNGGYKIDDEGRSWYIKLWSMGSKDMRSILEGKRGDLEDRKNIQEKQAKAERQPAPGLEFLSEIGGIIGGNTGETSHEDSRTGKIAWDGMDTEGKSTFERDAAERRTALYRETGWKGHNPLYDEVKRTLEWEYKYGEASRVPVKVSVTEIKRIFAFEHSEELPAFKVYTPPLVKKPAFLEESRELDAARAGTVMHFVMQHLDFKRVGSEEQIKSQVGEMVEKELLTGQQAKAVDAGKIYGFFCSPLGKRLLDSVKVYREVPFNIEIKSRDIYPHLDESLYEDETLLLQGVIDCFFEEEDGLVLLDYKTDYVDRAGGKDAICRVREQYRT
ncbi:MAG: hypothetical protein GX754_08700, partial [Clostridiaceae bacterium]|nr:hypothetical protein [Clostridiaceae bacterium]